ncbi:MAG: diguanylate cyclase [Methylococcales bacterium]|nr:diguanylate cyclase [Methylococcales bacterium]
MWLCLTLSCSGHPTKSGRAKIITIGIGISLYPDDSTEINSLIHPADKRMYQSKHSTR